MERVVFPAVSAVLCVGAAGAYLLVADYARAVYWTCAAIMTIVVTFGI